MFSKNKAIAPPLSNHNLGNHSYQTDHGSYASVVFYIQETPATYSNKPAINDPEITNVHNEDLNLLKNLILKTNNPLNYGQLNNTQIAKLIILDLLQKNLSLSRISAEIRVSNLTLQNCLNGKTKTLSRRSFLKILAFYSSQAKFS